MCATSFFFFFLSSQPSFLQWPFIFHRGFQHLRLLCSILLCLSPGVKRQFAPWEPGQDEIELLRRNPKRRKVSENSHIGVCFSLCVPACVQRAVAVRGYRCCLLSLRRFSSWYGRVNWIYIIHDFLFTWSWNNWFSLLKQLIESLLSNKHYWICKSSRPWCCVLIMLLALSFQRQGKFQFWWSELRLPIGNTILEL